MENLVWIIYLIETIIDGDFVPSVFWGIIISIIGGCLGIAMYMDIWQGTVENLLKFLDRIKWKYITIMSIWMLMTLTGKLIPSQETSYKMLAAYGVTEAYTAAQESDKVQAIAGKSLKVLEKAMDSYLDEGE